MQNKTVITTTSKLAACIAVIVFLLLCFLVTSGTLVVSMLSTEQGFFQTGIVKINLNDSKPIIEEREFIFQPGSTIKKDFFVKNESTCDIYYRLYFKNVNGELADVLQVQICDEEEILFSGTPREFNQENVRAADHVLKIGERRDMQIYFHLPEEANDEVQNAFLTFDMAADGVQTKNNENKEF